MRRLRQGSTRKSPHAAGEPRRRGNFAAVVACLLLVLALAAPAWARELVIQDFNEQVTVNSDGSLDVTELIEVHFIGHWNGLYRTIPVQYVGSGGLNYDLLLTPVSITDDSGNKLKYEESREGRSVKFKIYVPGAEDAVRTIEIHYRVQDAIRFFSDHDELYWNVTGTEWDVPIQAASAHIELPGAVTGLHATAFTGAFGSRASDAQVTVGTNTVDVVSSGPLGYHQGLTAVVGWNKGAVHEPGALAKILFYVSSNWPLILPIAALVIMAWLWWTRGRDPEQDVVTVQYDPPDNLTPAECGALVEDEAEMRGITATLVDLAVKGYLVIEQTQKDKMLGLMHDKDFIFHLKKPAAEWAAARPHEREMLAAIFDDGATTDVALSSLQNRFYTSLPGIRDQIFDSLLRDGYFLHRPDTVRQSYIGGGVVLAILMVVAGIGFSNALHTAPLAWIIAGALTAAIVCGFGWFMPARTLAGAKTYAKVLGFKDFLSRVEGDRIARLEKTPELFEKFLPFAMALAVEKKWVEAFQGIAMQPPTWYQGAYGSGFYPYLLVNDLNVMSVQAGSVLASSPQSTSAGGSGFGGGGMSGGGFGGGGGGGF